MDYDTLTKYCDTHSVKSADEARDIAIEWQSAISDMPFPDSLSYGEVAAWSDYFNKLAHKFPELREEFTENGII